MQLCPIDTNLAHQRKELLTLGVRKRDRVICTDRKNHLPSPKDHPAMCPQARRFKMALGGFREQRRERVLESLFTGLKAAYYPG